jgi:hypothetical protein
MEKSTAGMKRYGKTRETEEYKGKSAMDAEYIVR